MKKLYLKKTALSSSIIMIFFINPLLFANDTEIYLNVPTDVSATNTARPNIYFLIDDSTSMNQNLAGNGTITNPSGIVNDIPISAQRMTILKNVMKTLIDDLADKDQVNVGIGAINQFLFDSSYQYKLQGESGPGSTITPTQAASASSYRVIVPIKEYKQFLSNQLEESALARFPRSSNGTPLFLPLVEASMNLAMVSHNRANNLACKQKDAIVFLSDGAPNSFGSVGMVAEVENATANTTKYNNFNQNNTTGRKFFNANSTNKVCNWPSAVPRTNNVFSDQFRCMQAWSEYIASGNKIPTNVLSTSNNIPNRNVTNPTYDKANDIAVYTIFFGSIDTPALQGARDGMAAIATAGHGQAFHAGNADQLATAFANIVEKVVTLNQTLLVAPSAASGSYRMFGRNKDLFYAYFKPELTEAWPGNLKRYRATKATYKGKYQPVIIDKNGKVAFEPDTGDYIKDTSSYWSSGNDGGEVVKGGAVDNLGTSPTTRPLYTYTGTNPSPGSTSSVALTAVNNANASLFGLANDTQRNALLNNLYKTKHLGDIMHSSPNLFEYKKDVNANRIRQAAIGNDSDLKDEVYAVVGTNEGYIHIIDTANGTEKVSFIPKELLTNLNAYNTNADITTGYKNVFGMDGHITVDVLYNNTAVSDIITAKEVNIYAGMRRGGRNYYALSYNGGTNLRLKWVIESGKNGFSNLGQTWSPMYKGRIRWGVDEKEVLIFSGGYDPRQDEQKNVPKWSQSTSYNNNDLVLYDNKYYQAKKKVNANGSNPAANAADWTAFNESPGGLLPTGKDTVGNSIYIVDMQTGEKLWEASGSNNPKADFIVNKMDNSIPGGLLLSDSNRDGLVDVLFFADTGGKVFRIDLHDKVSSVTAAANVSINKSNLGRSSAVIAELADENSKTTSKGYRKFYTAPSVEYDLKSSEFRLAIGSGYRAHPLNPAVSDRIYLLKFPMKTLDSSFSTIKETDLVEANLNAKGLSSSPKGWFVKLNSVGEKVLNPILVSGGALIATTYTLPGNKPVTDPCVIEIDVGSGNAYILSTKNATEALGYDATRESKAFSTKIDLSQHGIKGIPAGASMVNVESEYKTDPVTGQKKPVTPTTPHVTIGNTFILPDGDPNDSDCPITTPQCLERGEAGSDRAPHAQFWYEVNQ